MPNLQPVCLEQTQRDTCALSPQEIRMTPGISCRREGTAEAKEATGGEAVSQRKNYNSSEDLAGEIDLVGQSRD